MAISKIQYDDKVAINIDSTIPDINKCNASDLNEIKSVVNNNADEIPTISDEYGTSTADGYSQNYINENTINPSGEPSTSEEDVSSATFTNTLEAPMNIDLKGNTLQNGTPTPSSPIPINNVSGDNQVNVLGKNSFNIQTLVKGRLDNGVIGYASNTTDLTLNENSFSFTTNANYRGVSTDFIKVEGTEYIVHCTQPSTLLITTACYDRNKTYLRDAGISYIPQHNNQAKISIQSDVAFIRINIYLSQAGTITIENPQLEKSFIPTTYEAYNGTTYNIDLPVENLFDKDTMVLNAFINQSNLQLASSNDFRTIYIPCKPNTTYTIQKIQSNRFVWGFTSDDNLTIPKILSGVGGENTEIQKTITSTNDAKYMFVMVSKITDDTTNINDLLNSIQIEEDSKPNTYTPYGTTPIELNKIGTYQDYFYKENDKWYLHKEIGKVVLSNYNWTQETTANSRRYGTEDIKNIVKKPQTNGTTMDLLSNIYVKNNASWSWNATSGKGICIQTNGAIIVYDDSYTASTDLSNFTTMLSNTNAILEYPLATPTNTEITYTPLIEQLESIKNAMSKEGTTNVNQVNNDLPFMLDLSVFNDTYNGRYQSVLEMYKRLSNQ